MIQTFFKFHGTGNDFILIDNRDGSFQPSADLVRRLCDRHLGIGADGLILLQSREGFDFCMQYFNSDGRESTMCGNGGRSVTAFAHQLGIIANSARFSAIDGVHQAEILSAEGEDFIVRVQLRDATVDTATPTGTFVDTGSPHLVRFVSETDPLDVVREGRRIRNSKRFFTEGVNVDFVEILRDALKVRTYERGVEDETLSCGTGVTAAALVTASKFTDNKGHYLVRTRGGELRVSFAQNRNAFSNIWLEGPVKMVFKGEVHV